MAETEKIKAGDIQKTLTELRQEKIFLKFKLADKNYEGLTFITGFQKRKGGQHLSIDYPDGFEDAVADMDEWPLRFEFTGRDKIKYVFNSPGGHIHQGKIWIQFPGEIERFQRRKLFRLEAPPGTRLHLNTKDIRYELLVINVSIGGTFGALVKPARQNAMDQVLHEDTTVEDAKLTFSYKNEVQIVSIKRGKIQRVNRNSSTGRYQYAIEFIDISEHNENKLTKLIYRFQREHLKKRKQLKKN